jgi:hypothetical protein
VKYRVKVEKVCPDCGVFLTDPRKDRCAPCSSERGDELKITRDRARRARQRVERELARAPRNDPR